MADHHPDVEVEPKKGAGVLSGKPSPTEEARKMIIYCAINWIKDYKKYADDLIKNATELLKGTRLELKYFDKASGEISTDKDFISADDYGEIFGGHAFEDSDKDVKKIRIALVKKVAGDNKKVWKEKLSKDKFSAGSYKIKFDKKDIQPIESFKSSVDVNISFQNRKLKKSEITAPWNKSSFSNEISATLQSGKDDFQHTLGKKDLTIPWPEKIKDFLVKNIGSSHAEVSITLNYKTELSAHSEKGNIIMAMETLRNKEKDKHITKSLVNAVVHEIFHVLQFFSNNFSITHKYTYFPNQVKGGFAGLGHCAFKASIKPTNWNTRTKDLKINKEGNCIMYHKWHKNYHNASLCENCQELLNNYKDSNFNTIMGAIKPT